MTTYTRWAIVHESGVLALAWSLFDNDQPTDTIVWDHKPSAEEIAQEIKHVCCSKDCKLFLAEITTRILEQVPRGV